MKNKIHLDLCLENGAEVDIAITVNGKSSLNFKLCKC